MELNEVMAALELKGSEQIKNIFRKHGAREPFFGVKVQDLKVILKGNKNNQDLAEELYKTGNTDAMYLAGLMADNKLISKATLQNWVDGAYWYHLSEYTVPWLAAESKHGLSLATEWIEDKRPGVQAAGWSTFTSMLVIELEEPLDENMLIRLMSRVEKEIHSQEPRVRYTMNNFIIAVGASSENLLDLAKASAKRIGLVEVHMPNVKCNVPDAISYMKKIEDKGRIGKKKKMARC
jgi:3-methyladenine DNA glycosylase AlkD